MNAHFLPLLVLPLAFGFLRGHTGKYIYSALVTLACLMIVLIANVPGVLWMTLGFAFSVAGDYLLANVKNKDLRFITGVSGFFLAHICFLARTLMDVRFTWISGVIAILLCAGYGTFLLKGLFPNTKNSVLRVALTLYILISVCVFSTSFSVNFPLLPKVLFVSGVFMIVFSDTLIGLENFMHRKRFKTWILPTYYLCHILMTAAMLLL